MAAIIILITAQHYLLRVSHENMWLHNIHYLLYFLPILMGAIWHGLFGGLATSVLVSILYAPVVFGQSGEGVTTSVAQRVLELMIYNVVGLVTGILSERQRRESEGYRQAAEELQYAYERLRAQTDLIVEKEHQLRRAERLSTLGELAAGIAHQIRNPLASIKGTAEILIDPTTPQARKEEFAQLMLEESNRLNRVVDDFLKLARFNRLHRQQANINDIMGRMLQFIDFRIDKSKIEVHTELGAGLPATDLDVSQMEHAVLNVLLNAVGAMPDGGRLSVGTTLERGNEGDRILIRIEDSGSGIEHEHLAHIFEPFYTTREGGTGLGLPIAKRIIKAHGGDVEIDSEAGRYTRVLISLPLDAGD